ncbi:Citron Rho-interacting kinase [Lucilia cuprina]|nr:Citron Rho-interacting kinase [Lucilia cuprina]
MAQLRDAISVRTTRLNNVLLGGGRSYGVSAALAETMTRESLLDAFNLLYHECDKETLRKRDKNIAEFVNKYRSIMEETNRLRVNVEDFSVRTLIGKGYFGNVHLVVERLTGDVYAMKKIKKSVVTTSQVKEERDIMSKRCSEWITNLQYAFQDNEHLYLVMEYLPGGDLLSLMSRHGPFDEPWTRFYLAELTLAIHALHEMGYVHRDIKPENILIDRFGHIKLADFGNAAALDRDGHVFSLSPVGTPDYIAPELLQTISTYKLTKNMHDVSCDYWSMGIIGYELICEITPFHEDNVHETYSKILSHCEESSLKELISYPQDLKVSNNYKHLIESLVTNPSKRLNYEAIRKHPFFENIKWENLRSEVPPIIPKLQGNDDTSNFEDVQRKKTKVAGPNAKKSLTTMMGSNEFCGKDLPFIGYSFVHMERNEVEAGAIEDARFTKVNNKLKELQQKHKERLGEITQLKHELLRAELTAKQSNTQSKILQDAKDEITKMKNIIKDKNLEVANCRTQIKTLQSSLKIEQEMWEKKEATITDLLRMNRQKYEDAKNATESRYEKRIAEKKAEINAINKKLDEREAELTAKVEECAHLQEKMENYKEMLKQQKEQAQRDLEEFEKNKTNLIDIYEQKLIELRNKLRHEKDHKSRLTMELRDVRSELDDSIICTKSTEEAKQATAKTTDEIIKRLNEEIKANNELHKQNTEYQQKYSEMQKQMETLQQDVNRLERELQVAECSKNLAESNLVNQTSPYETAPGSLTDIRVIEEQLRADLETAKENENTQKARADKLQDIVAKLEEMLERFNEQSLSPTKPLPAPRNGGGGGGHGHQIQCVGDMLEKQNEKLEDKLAAVREQMIVERQSARTANLALWKAEKQLEEVLAEKKMTQRRMELTEERIKKMQAEKEEAIRLGKLTEEAKKQKEERIEEMKQEIKALKADIQKEHRMWERAEQERMKCKSEIIEHISNCKKMEEKLSEVRQKLQQCQQKCDKLDVENKTLIKDINEEKDRHSNTIDQCSALQIQLKNLQDNYERLKYACTVTDTQLTEVETMLEKEQKCNKSQQEKLDQLYAAARKKDELQAQLKKQLAEEQLQRQANETKISDLTSELQECRSSLEELQRKFSNQQQYAMEQTTNLFITQEKVEVLQNENQNIQAVNDNHQRELLLLKEENARILSELFIAKEECQQLQQNLKDVYGQNNELQSEVQDLKRQQEEKENFYLQRDIKSEATLAQHKKLIDYLQLKVEDLTQKKKKTLADKLFGTNNSSNSSKKENMGPSSIESSILYRTLHEELKREKLKSKSLQEQLDKLQEKQNSLTMRSPLKSKENQAEQKTRTLTKSPKKQEENRISLTTANTTSPKKNNLDIDEVEGSAKHLQAHHRFELALQETNIDAVNCLACKNPIISGAAFWKCRECKNAAHRKCRSDVKQACGDVGAILAAFASEPAAECLESLGMVATAPLETDLDAESVGKFSYEGKLDENDEGTSCDDSLSLANKKYQGSLVFSVPQNYTEDTLEVACAYEMEENKILLLGCNTGLYALHLEQQKLVHIAGVDAVSCIAISQPLAKVIMVGSNGESLYQCDLRHLQSRCQASACLRPALEASVLDLPFANRTSTEKWKLVQISQESEQPLDTVAIASTSTRIVILKYDVKQQKFKPVRALDTATPVSSIFYTRHTAIVASDKFFEIDLSTYGAEEFVDVADQSLSHTQNCQPVIALRISKQELLLCFMECGVFVDEYGCRSRPYDLNWEYTPCGFMYRAPFLYVAHFQSVQIIRLHRSYTNEMMTAAGGAAAQKDLDADVDDTNSGGPQLKRSYIPFYMPTLLNESGKFNAFMLAIQKTTGLQEIYHLDALQTFRQQHNESVLIDTIFLSLNHLLPLL